MSNRGGAVVLTEEVFRQEGDYCEQLNRKGRREREEDWEGRVVEYQEQVTHISDDLPSVTLDTPGFLPAFTASGFPDSFLDTLKEGTVLAVRGQVRSCECDEYLSLWVEVKHWELE